MIWLLITAAAIGWLVSLYVHPFGPCRKCKGTGTNRGSTRRKFGQCKRCHGTRSRQRLGSRQVHKTVKAIRAKAWETKK